MKAKKNFRIHSSSFFLTYKQPTENFLTKEFILCELKKKFSYKEECNIQTIVVSFEKSDNVHPYQHFHVLIKLFKKSDIRNSRFLDIKEVHGQYERTQNFKKALAYVVKEKNFISEGPNPYQMIATDIKDPFKRFVHICIYQSKKFYEATAILKPQSTFFELDIYTDFIKFPQRYERFLASFYYSPNVPQLYIEIRASLFNQLTTILVNKQKSLYLYGATGVGKTSLFLVALQDRILFVRHKDALKKLDNQHHLAILFDDMCFKRFDKEDFINLVDQTSPSHVDVKRSMVTIQPTTSKLFTSNKDPLTWLGIKDPSKLSEQDKAILRRVHPIELTKEDIKVHTKPVLKALNPNNILITWKTLRQLIETGTFPE